CFIDDLIDGFIYLMNAPDDVTGPINLGNPQEFTIKQLAELVIQITGSKSRLIFEDLPEDDPLQRCPDISLAKQKLDWYPSIDLEVGIEKTINYFSMVI
ncbi:MAG: SDR family NAD-dependent epimerase/dehydratase, partial [Pseudomonadota bacterium]|nr:SDR family NAD-dependent epimerase/dehydratase [Pseudomonadota bacterium]